MDYLYSGRENNIGSNVTIFAIPKPFIGHIGIIQQNAITSWTLLHPQPEVILFGDEAGTRELSQKLGLIHVPEVKLNEYGTPLLSGIFAEAHQRASNGVLAYVNADLILINDFTSAIQSVSQQLKDFLIIGRRWNLEITQKLEFDAKWQDRLKQLIMSQGCLAPQNCKDYFVFPRHLFAEIPAFAVGRGYWDTWMVNQAVACNYPVVDASLTATVIHQDHDYAHLRGGKNEAYMGKEAQINKAFERVGGEGNIADATWLLKASASQNLPQISIVIITGDRLIPIDKTVLSVLGQDYRSREIIAIDNSNQNATIQNLLHPYCQHINYIQFPEGTIAAYNYGLKIARGELILFLTGGDFLLAGTLSRQVDYFTKEASTLDLLLSGVKRSPASQRAEPQPWTILPNLQDIHIWQLERIWQPLSKSNVIWRRERLEQIGGFSPQLHPQLTFVEAIICLIMLRGSRAEWFSEITSIQHHAEHSSILPSDRDLKRTTDSLFRRSAVKEWMRLLQAKAYS